MEGAEGETVVVSVAVVLTVPVAQGEALAAPEALPLSVGLTVLVSDSVDVVHTEDVGVVVRHRVGEGDCEMDTVSLRVPATVTVARGEEVAEGDTVPVREPVMLCVMVSEAEGHTVIVGDCDRDSVTVSVRVPEGVPVAEAEEHALREALPVELALPALEALTEALAVDVARPEGDKEPVAEGLPVTEADMVAEGVAVRHREPLGVMDSVLVVVPLLPGDREKVSEGV